MSRDYVLKHPSILLSNERKKLKLLKIQDDSEGIEVVESKI